MRVLMPLHGFVAWNGGLDLVRSMSNALRAVASERDLALTFAIPHPSFLQRSIAGAWRRWRLLRSTDAAAAARNTDAVLARAIEQITADFPNLVCDAGPGGIQKAADQIDSNLIFPTMLPLGGSARKRVGYVFDFQHHYLPHFFSPRIRANRDRRFAAIVHDADGIVVNSRATAADATRILGVPSERILAMPFAPYALPWWFDSDPDEIRRQYGVGDRFLLVCNHFWVHKDHETAIRSLSMLHAESGMSDLELVMTGDPVDHRDPSHYGRLVDLVEKLRLNKHVHFLGLVPKRHQLGLMRACALVIQPTRFEGGPGGGSVAEAIGLGVPAVVSDIDVNREIDVGNAQFFRTGDSTDLAAKAAQALALQTMRPTQETLLKNGERSLSRLGDVITDYLLKIALIRT